MKAKQTIKAKVIERIMKKFYRDEKETKKMVAMYWELAARSGCETTKDYFDLITGLWAA